MFRENIIAELKDKIACDPQNIENYKSLANYYIGCDDLSNALLIYKKILECENE